MAVKIALCQMMVDEYKEKSLFTAESMIREAATQGARIVVLPEMFCCPYKNVCFPIYAEPGDGPVEQRLAALAKELGIYLFGGTIPESDGGKLYNTCYVYGPDGSLLGRNRKVHLFDVNIEGGVRFMESEVLTPGNEMTIVETEFGKIGVAVCFDLRFAEWFRLMALEGVQMVVVPAAFNTVTGPAHWELTLRARALDNQIFMAACAPARDMSKDSYHSYGHSIVTGPWGDVLAQGDEKQGILYHEIDFDEVEKIRRQLPILSARRTDLYTISLNSKQAE